jgi:hypothetical protein
MKNLILSLVMLTTSFISFSQVYEVGFSRYCNFNSGSHGKYVDVIDSSNYLCRVDKFDNGIHKYVIDLTNNTIKKYFDYQLVESATIITSKKVGDLVYVTVNDKEFLTENKVVLTAVINTNKNNELYPKFVLFGFCTSNNATNGTVSMK